MLWKILGIFIGICFSVEEVVVAYFVKESVCVNYLGVGGLFLVVDYWVNCLKVLELVLS